jgi:biotin operon repressor
MSGPQIREALRISRATYQRRARELRQLRALLPVSVGA